jgi:hypothetical protein
MTVPSLSRAPIRSLLDQPDTVDRAVRVLPLAAGAAFRGEQILFLVIAQRPNADACP